MNDYALGEVVYLAFTTRAFATGIPTALAGSPTLEIYENDSTSPIVEGASKLVLTQNLNSINGFNLATITATTGNGFEVGKDYHLVLKTGTVGGTSVVGEVVGRFSIGRLNVTKWAATTVTLSATTALPEVDAKSISNDATAADNLELACDNYSATRGLSGTALPDAAADAAGGLPISDAGGLDVDAKLANTNEVTAARMAVLTDWINGGRLDLILDIIAADVVNLDGAAMRGTDGANTTAPDNAGIAAILADTGTDIPALIAALNNLNAADAATAVWAKLLLAGFSADRILRIIASAVAAKVSGGPANPVFRTLLDDANMITGAADSSGNRSSVTFGA